MLFLAGLVVNSFAIWLAAEVVAGIGLRLPGESTAANALFVIAIGLVFTLINMLVKPVVKLLTLPLIILTLGLFLLVINALMLMLTSWATSYLDFGLVVSGFWAAFFGAIIIALVNLILGMIIPTKSR
ncbi:phage holin family protein [Hoyosella rhizosphaerae]|nr:phage holin family protein [Hoyosella rhizosphaerae]MBN4925279.1 phage holin family protein [Hoyosella rhizosphaerae]